MSDRIERAREVNRILRHQKVAIDDSLPRMLNQGMILANNDAAKARDVVSSLGISSELLEVRDWVVNMVTKPGDLVYNPAKTYAFSYSGNTNYTHANSTFFPGASGVYYWSVIPHILEDVKVYPDIAGIIVSVKKDEIWWDKAKKNKWKWNGADNPSCSWEPKAGNEWTKIS